MKVKKYKLKSISGAKKRFKKTGSGRYIHKHSHHSHILTKKSQKRKKNLGLSAVVKHCDERAIRQMLVD